MSAAEATPPAAASKPALALDVVLRSGMELTTGDLDALAREHPATLVALVGPPDAGKTTLVATLYEQFRQAKVPDFVFAGSHSLLAFERRCHLSRLVSNLEQPQTERSNSSDEELFYHLRVARPGDSVHKEDVFLLDVAGEGYQELRTSADACRAITSLQRVDFLVLLIDGEKLTKPASRYLALFQAVNFLQCVWDSGAIAHACLLQVVMTKADKLPTAERATLAAELRNTIEAQIGSRFPTREFAQVAARPDNPGVLPTGYGLASLFGCWLDRVVQSLPDDPFPAAIVGERESEAFARRYFSGPSV